MSHSLTQSDLHFSPASTNINSLARQIHHARISQSISARLHSIDADAAFVVAQARLLQLPVIANERCGSWYVPPDIKAGSAYFKSTDGHHGEWSFSLRRLNLHLLRIIGERGGCIVVDSTRRGKHAPDALAKTVPIWCAVLNRILFPDQPRVHDVKLHPRLVNESERAQIEARVPGFVQQALNLKLDLDALTKLVQKPLEPRWMIQSIDVSSERSHDVHFASENPVYLCMASHFSIQRDDQNYIQGAGDDSESWAAGLTPELFWGNRTNILSASDQELPAIVAEIQKQPSCDMTDVEHPIQVSTLPPIYVGSTKALSGSPEDSALVLIGASMTQQSYRINRKYNSILPMQCNGGKQGSRELRRELLKLPSFLNSLQAKSKIVVLCPTGNDLSVGVALAIICSYPKSNDVSNGDGTSNEQEGAGGLDPCRTSPIGKSMVKRELAHMTAKMPKIHPSRATLTAVNSFLIAAPR